MFASAWRPARRRDMPGTTPRDSTREGYIGECAASVRGDPHPVRVYRCARRVEYRCVRHESAPRWPYAHDQAARFVTGAPPAPWQRTDLGATVGRRKQVSAARRRRAQLRAASTRLRGRPGVRDCYLSNGALRIVLTNQSVVCKTAEEAARVERYLAHAHAGPGRRARQP